MPSLFLSHGSPMTALEPGSAGSAWAALAAATPRPQAVLVASAHWETEAPTLGGSAAPSTIHDFGGFPEALYAIRYPARGAPEVAAEAAGLLRRAGFAADVDQARGLDHGAWVPLMHMFPDADVPVLELSVQPARNASHHLALGRALAPLRDQGVLIVGSGHATHNLRDWHLTRRSNVELDYVRAFADWLSGRLAAHDDDALAHWQARGPSAARAHPTDEHLLPLFVAFGAGGDASRVERVYEDTLDGALAMDAYRFD